MTLIKFLLGVGVLQGAVLAGVLLYARSGHRLANAIMAALVLATAGMLLQKLFIQLGVFQQYPQYSVVLNQLRFTWGPLLYLYALSMTGTKLSLRQSGHFLPAIILITLNLVKFWQLDADQQRLFSTYLFNYLNSDPGTEAIIFEFMGDFWRALITNYFHLIFFIVQSATYCLLVLKLLKAHNQRLELHFSSLEKMNLRWLRSLTLAFLTILALLLLFNRLPLLFNYYDITFPLANAYAVLLVVLFYAIAISALLQPSLISGVMQARNSEPAWTKRQGDKLTPIDEDTLQANDLPTSPSVHTDNNEADQEGKYQHSKLSKEDANRFKIKLIEVMQAEELYLNCDLTLPELAKSVDLTAHQVSQALNGQMNQNFFSFVNSYRIDQARDILLDPETASMPIVELAFEVGFKSKSSFYDAFKRATNMTPTQFKRAMKETSIE